MLSSAVLALLLACSGGETAKEAAPPPAEEEAKAPPKEEMKEEVKEEAEEEAKTEKQVEKISRTFRVPVAEKATIANKARTQIIEQAKKAGYDRADNVKVEKEECDDRVCTVTVTADATKTVAAPKEEGADNACNPCGGDEEAAEGADNACAPEAAGE